MSLFKHLVNLLDQTVEDRIRICFVICAYKAEIAQGNDRMLNLLDAAHLMANHQDLQLQACDTNAMTKIIAIVKEVDSDGLKGETENNKARLLEVSSYALINSASC